MNKPEKLVKGQSRMNNLEKLAIKNEQSRETGNQE
jgi:hypothetical protein